MDPRHTREKDGLEDEAPVDEGNYSIGPDNQDDGGYGWVIVACSFTAFSLMSFNFLTFGIFAPELATAFSLSESEVGFLASMNNGVFFLTSLYDFFVNK